MLTLLEFSFFILKNKILIQIFIFLLLVHYNHSIIIYNKQNYAQNIAVTS